MASKQSFHRSFLWAFTSRRRQLVLLAATCAASSWTLAASQLRAQESTAPAQSAPAQAVAEPSSDAPADQAPQRRRRRRRVEEGFEALLGAEAKTKWRGYKSEEWPEGWEVEGNVLHRTGSGGDLMTIAEYGDFDLRFAWKVSEGGNSGVIYRVSLGDPASYFSGMEYQVLDNDKHADGKSPLTSGAALYALYPAEEAEIAPVGSWNRSRIVVQGNHVQHFVNGKKVVDAEIGSDDWNERLAKSKFASWEKYAKNARGHIAFQDHGDEVWFRNIRIKSLDK